MWTDLNPHCLKESLVKINSAFFIFKKINFLKILQRISKNNYFYEINFTEYIDRIIKNQLIKRFGFIEDNPYTKFF